MKKSLVMFLVATLLLAGCTELMSDDGEKTVEVNEEVALEKITAIVNPSDDSAWGMTYIMEMNMDGMTDMMGDSMNSEDSATDPDGGTPTMMTVEMTTAMSPDGVHVAQIMTMSSEETMGNEIEIIQKWTQNGDTIYLETGFSMPADSDMTSEEKAMYEAMMETQEFNMKSALTHTEAMEIMNEPMNDADFNPQEMLMSLCMVETLGTFTPLPDEDGLTMYRVSMENTDTITGQQVLKMWDSNDDQSLSWDEFNQDMCGEPPFEDKEAATFEAFFNDADVNNDSGLTLDELDAFIADVDEHSSDNDFEDEDNDCDGCEDQDGKQGESMDIDFAFNSQGNVEFFRMDMGNEGNMIVYLLSDSKIESLTTSTNDGESEALPFILEEKSNMDESDEFMCDDGSTIPMSYVNDGYEDCDGGEDEDVTDGSDDEMTLDDFDVSSWDSTNDLQQIIDWFDDNYDYDENETVMTVEDFLSDCGADEDSVDNYVAECVFNNAKEMLELSGHEDYEMWTFLREMSECDSDTDEMVDFEELDACVSMDLTNDGHDSDSFEGLQEMFDMVDANEDGMLDSDEFATFAAMTSGEPMMVCYNMDTHEIDFSIDSEAGCDAAGLMWTEEDSGPDDGEDEDATDGSDDGNNGHGNDDDGHDESNPGNSFDEGIVYTLSTGEAMIPFEGGFNDYSIVLANCEDSYDEDTESETKVCDNEMTVSMTDAMIAGSSIMFHDADSSGTISDGDMIHISETIDVDYEEVRLYSSSADAYSDENPVFEMPGFTGVVGVLALLGAALLRRKA
mgnify:FL=1